MKKTFLAAFCVIGFVFIAGPIFVKNEVRQILINGKPFSKALLISGVWSLSMEDVIKGAGETASAEPSFKLQGRTLFASCATGEHFKKAQVTYRTDPSSPGPKGQFFRVNRDGVISTNVVMFQGKAYLPVADFFKSITGGVFNPTNTSEPFNFNFAVNGDGILGVQQ